MIGYSYRCVPIPRSARLHVQRELMRVDMKERLAARPEPESSSEMAIREHSQKREITTPMRLKAPRIPGAAPSTRLTVGVRLAALV
jgi:hypothetical protein